MRATQQAVPAAAGRRPTPTVPAQIQRCGGVQCPPRTCNHDDETIHRSSWSAAPTRIPPAVRAVLRTPGEPLAADTRTSMERRFGHDFSQVRIHSDRMAGESAQAIQARAYTFGRHIVMGAGQYQPRTGAATRLLIHELTHVVQQGNPGTDLGYPTAISHPHDASERGAEQVTAGVLSPAVRPSACLPSALIARQVASDLPAGPVDTGSQEADDSASDEEETVDPEQNAEESAAEEEGFDEAAQADAQQEDTLRSIVEGASGVAYGSLQSLTPGGFLAPSPAPQSRLFEFFRGAGQFATGVAELATGAGGEVLGGGLDVTGVGAVVGVPLNIASAGVIVQGAASTAAGVKTLINAMSMSGSAAGGGGPRLPAKGTPQRAAMESARRSGIRGAQRRELDNIRAGGKGTAGNRVWTDKELARIRKTGKFPKDTRWHHNPTVASRPDLAGDPDVVRPVRGGVAGHLKAHGGDFRK